MVCPGCGYQNEEAAAACNLCGKLLIAKSAPKPPPVAAPTPKAASAPPVPAVGVPAPVSSASRIPSWPNRAVLCFLATPALAAVALFILLAWDRDQDTMSPQGPNWFMLSLVISSAGCLAVTVPLAARLAIAPLFAAVVSVLMLIAGMALSGAMSTAMFWIYAGGAGMAWYGRTSFTRPWQPQSLLRWTLQGYRRLLAPDRWAALRLIGGVVLFAGGIVFMLGVGMAIQRSVGISRGLAKMLAIPTFIGGFLAASGLSVFEAPDVEKAP